MRLLLQKNLEAGLLEVPVGGQGLPSSSLKTAM